MVTVSAELAQELKSFPGRVELYDPQGQLIGIVDRSDIELVQKARETMRNCTVWSTTEEVLEHMKSRTTS